MSFGSTFSSEAPITPSNTIRGDELAPKVERPLNLTLNPEFGFPPGRVIDKPATLPCKSWAGFDTLPLLKSSGFTPTTADVISFLSCDP